jgi:hypothetical protein
MFAQKQRHGAHAVRRLAIHVKKAWISKEIASWAERSAFPNWQESRHPHCHFRGLLRLYARYGPSDRSVTQGDLCHEASVPPVTQRNRSSARQARDKKLDHGDEARSLVWMLAQMRAMVETQALERLEQRLEEIAPSIEGKAHGYQGANHPSRTAH